MLSSKYFEVDVPDVVVDGFTAIFGVVHLVEHALLGAFLLPRLSLQLFATGLFVVVVGL